MDLRYAIRSLKRNPGFTLVAVLTLALGIGANTTVFSWMEGLVLDPFPAVRDPSRLVSVKLLTHGETSDLMSYPTFAALRAGARAVDGMAAFQFTQFGLQERASSGSAGPVWGAFASSDYFTTLGVRPVLGRGFLPSDSIAGAEPIVLLGNALWRRRFGGDPNVIGRHVRINGHDAVVVGIAPPNFAGALAGLGLELWVPLTNYDQLGDHPGSLRSPYSSWLTVFGRLHPGASMAQARAELAAAARRAASEQPEMDATGATATQFDGGAAPRILTPMFTALLGATALVLLIVCANLANLMLGRAVARRREFGVRAALGAGRARLVRQQLVECLAIAVPGAVLGVALASWGRDALAALVPATNMPIVVDAPLDLRVMAFVVVLTMAAVVLFGLLPAMRASRIDLVAALKSGTAGAGMRRSRLRGAFVVAQVALSVVAVTSAALFVRTLHALERIDPGFHDPGRVLLVSTDFAFTGIRDTARVRTTVDRLIERTSAIPGVTGVAAASYVPMGLFGGDNLSLSLPGYTPARDEHPSAWMTHVTPGYFDVMRIPIVAGRALAATDPANDSARAIVVNESFAQRYLPGRDPVGASIALGFSSRPNATIVGVARNVVRAFDVVPTLSGPASPAIYAAYAGRPTTNVTLHVRAAGDPLALVTSVRSAFADVAPALPVLSPETMAEHATMAFFVQRVSATVLGALGAIVLLLAALGLYGVTAYAVTEQTHEVGVRIALGATTRQVVGEFLRQGLRLTAIGLGIGALLALASGRLLESQLYGVHGYDPVALVGASSLLALVALAASYVPARRAAAVDPIIALRAD